ncbi:MAG TPA: CHAT domain-containing tetratricopeptide repeat protein [Thermoanaerobaculia bacterium]|nr:CHAT domain-containing tetratricopeptide repeat protein [Thermoanaerobaculia bacterium]
MRSRVAAGLLSSLVAGTLAVAAQPPRLADPARAEAEHEVDGIDRIDLALAAAIDAHGRGEVLAAAEAFWRAAELAEASGDDATAAAAYNNASVLGNEAARYERALAAAERAVALRSLGAADTAMARALNNRGLSYLNLGRYDEAQSSFLEALALHRLVGDAEGEVVNLTNVAIVAERRGDFHGASRELSRALAVLQHHQGEPWTEARREAALQNLGVLRERLGDYRGALEVLAPLEGDLATGSGERERAVLLQNLAVVYRNLGDPLEAMERLRLAEDHYRRSGDSAGLAAVRLNLGIIRYLDLADASGALEPLSASLEQARALGERSLEAEALFHLGRARVLSGDLAGARQALDRSLAVAEAAGAGETRWLARWGLALLDERGGDLDRALDRLRLAMDEIETTRSALGGEVERGTYFADKRAVYAAAARVLLTQSQAGRQDRALAMAGDATEQALQVVWRAKGRLLWDALGGGSGEIGTAPPPVAAVQAGLGGEVLLEYFVAEDRLYRFVVDRERAVLEDRGDSAPVLANVREVHGRLAAGEEPSADAMAALGQVLLGDAWSDVAPRRVVVAADGLLRYLPFELLPFESLPPGDVPVGGFSATAGGPLLVDRSTLRYLPSGAFARGPARQRTAEIVVRGYAASEPAAELAAALGRQLPMLATARAEVEGMAAALGGRSTLRLGASATETNFRRDAATPVRVLHVAAHAVLAEDRGGVSALVLGADDQEDGLLRATEVAALSLDVGLVVLSACSTTLGIDDDARALESLAGAFLLAGADAVLATLWDVADQDASAFVEALAWELGRGHDAADALRRVKQRFRADPRWASPTRWAGFVLLGESTTVRPERALRRRLLWWGAGFLALAAAVGVAVRVAQRQSRKVSVSSTGAGG